MPSISGHVSPHSVYLALEDRLVSINAFFRLIRCVYMLLTMLHIYTEGNMVKTYVDVDLEGKQESNQ